MKLFRFMSLGEFQKYCNGEILINNTNHKENRQASNSIGFCFFNIADYKPEIMLHSLTGVANVSICVIFETKRENIRKSKGRYSRAINEYERESFIAKEYCTTTYSKDTFKLLEYAIPDWFNEEEWDWKEGVNYER